MTIAAAIFALFILTLLVSGLTLHVRDILDDRAEARRMETIRRTLDQRKKILGY